MNELKIGDQAPFFQGPDQDGNVVSLGDYAGRTVVLFFYPKDLTPGCTTEACSFRDQNLEFLRAGASILGVSPDHPRSHQKFINKHSLNFPLLADSDHQICESYQVWVEKSMYGKKYMGVERSTFVISPQGRLLHLFRKVKPETHVAEVLLALSKS